MDMAMPIEDQMSCAGISEELIWLKEAGISEDTLLQIYQEFNRNVFCALCNKSESCIESIQYFREIGLEDQMIEELLLYNTSLFLKHTSTIKTLIKAAALRKFVEDMPEDWDRYLCHIFEHLDGYAEPYLDFL